MDRRKFGQATLALAAGRCRLARGSPGARRPGQGLARRGTAPGAPSSDRWADGWAWRCSTPAPATLSGHRLDERFAMCSTFKVLAAALALARVDAGQEQLDRRVAVGPRDLLEWAPVRASMWGRRMSVAELCEAAVTLSDNTAANLLLASMGGPAGVTAFVRGVGDATTRLDRNEPTLNEARARRSARHLHAARDGADAARGGAGRRCRRPAARMGRWMTANTTGAKRLRAGVPGLARGRQDRHRPPRHHQRHRPAVAAGPRAAGGGGLPHRMQGAARCARGGAGRRGAARGRRRLGAGRLISRCPAALRAGRPTPRPPAPRRARTTRRPPPGSRRTPSASSSSSPRPRRAWPARSPRPPR